MEEPSDRLRLRWNEKIVGYARKMGPTVFFSTDQYAWHGNDITYNLCDHFAQLYDINRRPIYANDILELLNPEEHRFATLLYDELLQQFQLFTIDGDTLVSNQALEYLRDKRFVWKSYLFIQNEL